MKKGIENLFEKVEQIIYFLIHNVLRIKAFENNCDKIVEFVKFGIVGLSNTVISYLLYVILLVIFQKNGILPQVDYLVAQLVGFLISVLWSFYWNRNFVFKENEEPVPWWQALVKTYISYAFTGIFLNAILSIIWIEIINVPKMIAPILNLLISVPLNFILNKFWALGRKKK